MYCRFWSVQLRKATQLAREDALLRLFRSVFFRTAVTKGQDIDECLTSSFIIGIIDSLLQTKRKRRLTTATVNSIQRHPLRSLAPFPPFSSPSLCFNTALRCVSDNEFLFVLIPPWNMQAKKELLDTVKEMVSSSTNTSTKLVSYVQTVLLMEYGAALLFYRQFVLIMSLMTAGNGS